MRSSKPKLKRVRPLLGTYVEITLRGAASEKRLQEWITSGFESIAEIDRLMSRHRLDSDLSRLNEAEPGVWVKIHPHTVRVLRASNDLFRDSKGLFDIRCAAVPRAPRPPIEIHGTNVRKNGPWTFDLGGIAKGYAVDCAVKTIQRASRGHRISGIVNAGGDLRRWGPGSLPVALATSVVRTEKTSERLAQAAHVRMPEGTALSKPKAVTVAADRCIWSDALTKIMLMGTPAIAKSCLTKYHAQALFL